MIDRTMRSVLGIVGVCALAAGCAGDPICPSFVNIVAGGFGQTGDTLWWTLQVEELPTELTFNQEAVPADFLEYRWAIDIDSDRNGSVDLRAAIEHFAVMSAAPVTAGILSETSKDLLAVNGGLASTVGTFTASIDGNTFRFETTSAAAPGLASVTDRGQSTWTTSYRWGADPDDQCDQQVR